ncbi:hypothetical protein D3C84_1079690 [compost metagenome]
MLVGMLVKPCPGPSITYIRVPNTVTRVLTLSRKTMIFCRLPRRATSRKLAWVRYCVSLSTRNTRSIRSTRTMIRYWASA